VEEQRVLRLCVLDQPFHPVPNVGTCGSLVFVDAVVGQHDRVVVHETKVTADEAKEFASVVDASEKLVGVTKVVDTDQQGLFTYFSSGWWKNWPWNDGIGCGLCC